MAVLKIPEPYRAGLSVLACLTDDSYAEILNAAMRAPASFANHRELAVWIASEAKGLGSAEISKLISTLTALYRLRARYGIAVQKLASDVTAAARETVPNFKVPDGVDFEGRLAAMLGLESLNVLAVKAKELQTQSQRTFCDARVLTDVRPLFGENASELPTTAIIVHTLKLGFHDSGSPGHKDIYIALDAGDIAELRKVLQRAEEKTQSLKAVLDAAKLRSIDLSS